MSSSVLVVTNAYPDFPGSYHGIFVRRTAEMLCSMGWRSHVLVPRIFRDSPAHERLPTHEVTRFPFPSAQKLLIEYERPPLLRIGGLIVSGLWSALRTIRAQDCGLIHAHWAFPAGVIGMAVARLSGRPLLLTVHGSDWRMASTRGGIFRGTFLKVAECSERIISVNREISRWMADAGIADSKIYLQPVGADLEVFRGEASSCLRAPHSVISTRNLGEIYRIGDLLEAASIVRENLPGLKLTVAGDGPLRENLERDATGLGLSQCVKFSGRLEQRQLADKLAASTVYVSTSPVEGTSISLLEAMASGCLPVATDIPANRDWIKHGVNGLLFPPGDVDALSSCLRLALEDSGLAQAAATCNPGAVAKNGSFAAHVELTARLYKQLADA